MAQYTTPADYLAQSPKWRDFCALDDSAPYEDLVVQAQAAIEELRTFEPDVYKDFIAAAVAWATREQKLLDELREAAVGFDLSDCSHYYESFLCIPSFDLTKSA